MPKRSSVGAAAASLGGGGGGGIMNSGIFGMFGAVTNIQCSSESNSFYCNSMKVFNFLITAAVVLGLFYFLYTLWKSSRRRGRG